MVSPILLPVLPELSVLLIFGVTAVGDGGGGGSEAAATMVSAKLLGSMAQRGPERERTLGMNRQRRHPAWRAI